MKYSFIMIAYNEQKVIKQSLQSILNQNGLQDFEVVVVNDCSSDLTAEIVEQFANDQKQVRIINNHRNQGRGYSRKIGVESAKGQFIAFVDADVVLPLNWLQTCSQQLKTYDAVGGIATPDGDVCFIQRIFQLNPKVHKHTTAVSGGNALYKRRVLEKVNFDSTMRDGEDVDSTWKLGKEGFKTTSIPTLVCKHIENKPYHITLKWMYEQGAGSNRLLVRFKRLRLPDVTFILFCFILLITILTTTMSKYVWLLPISFIGLTTLAHILKKFKFDAKLLVNLVPAVLVQSTLIFAYLLGRLTNIAILFRGVF